MSLIKDLILAPVPWLERHAIKDGEFTYQAKGFMRRVVWFSAGIIGAEIIVSAIRFSEFGIQDWWFYALYAGFLGTIMLMTRSGAETSVDQMKHSSNLVVRFGAYGLSIVVSILLAIGGLLGAIRDGLDEAREQPLEYNVDTESDRPSYSKRMDDYMMGMSNDPPRGWH